MKKILVKILVITIVCILFVSCTKKEISDGIYSVDVTLEGGSGRSTIDNAKIEVIDGKMMAAIVWSSPFYEYMIVENIKYKPVQTCGNSTFEIPVTLDEKMNVSASTVAMSQPYLVDYTLFFDSKSLKGE